ncbi:MAG: preprotein translocase subunit SecG [Gammaproteobacteria bacterium]
MHTLLTVVHVLMAVSLITVILLQHGKGADAGAAFGSGASSTVFGARGSTSFLTKLTWGLVVIFFAVSFALNNMAAELAKGGKSVMERAAIKDDNPSGVIDSSVKPVEEQEDAAPAEKTRSDLPEIPLSGDNADTPPNIPETAAPEPADVQAADAPPDLADQSKPKAQDKGKSTTPAGSAPRAPEAAARAAGDQSAAPASKPAEKTKPQGKPAAAPKPAAEREVSSPAKTLILKAPAEGKPAAPSKAQGKAGTGPRE